MPNEQINNRLTKDEISKKVIEIVADKGCVEIETVTLDKTFKELGFDSLDNVDLIMSFENEFLIHISDTDMEKIVTVQNAVEFVAAHI
ncbi:MAG: acyl carrier protein [Nanoarchaeota archaeon]